MVTKKNMRRASIFFIIHGLKIERYFLCGIGVFITESEPYRAAPIGSVAIFMLPFKIFHCVSYTSGDGRGRAVLRSCTDFVVTLLLIYVF